MTRCNAALAHKELETDKPCICIKELGGPHIDSKHLCAHGWTWTNDDDIAPPKANEVDWEEEVNDTQTWQDFLSSIAYRDKKIEVSLAMVLSAGINDEGVTFTNVDAYGESPHLLLAQIGLLRNALRIAEDNLHGRRVENEPEL